MFFMCLKASRKHLLEGLGIVFLFSTSTIRFFLFENAKVSGFSKEKTTAALGKDRPRKGGVFRRRLSLRGNKEAIGSKSNQVSSETQEVVGALGIYKKNIRTKRTIEIGQPGKTKSENKPRAQLFFEH